MSDSMRADAYLTSHAAKVRVGDAFQADIPPLQTSPVPAVNDSLVSNADIVRDEQGPSIAAGAADAAQPDKRIKTEH